MRPVLVGDKYASKTFTVGASTTNYNVGGLQNIFANIGTCDVIYMKTDVDVNIKINSTSNDSILVKTSENLLPILMKGVTNIYVTTTGSAANITFLLLS